MINGVDCIQGSDFLTRLVARMTRIWLELCNLYEENLNDSNMDRFEVHFVQMDTKSKKKSQKLPQDVKKMEK